MIPEAERFPYVAQGAGEGDLNRFPCLPLTLGYQQQSVAAVGLLDTGASVNVLPYEVGIRLGGIWERQQVPVRLTGNLAALEARGIVLSGTVGRFAPVQLVFAWTRSEGIPLILGQMNFFQEFDACFFRRQSLFELKPSKPPEPPGG
jgi:hypothetical protein